MSVLVTCQDIFMQEVEESLGVMDIIQMFWWFWKLILAIVNPHRVIWQRYHLEQEGLVQVLSIVCIFVNIIYLLYEFTLINDSVLRIHTCDLRIGLKMGERGNEGSPVPPAWPPHSWELRRQALCCWMFLWQEEVMNFQLRNICPCFIVYHHISESAEVTQAKGMMEQWLCFWNKTYLKEWTDGFLLISPQKHS